MDHPARRLEGPPASGPDLDGSGGWFWSGLGERGVGRVLDRFEDRQSLADQPGRDLAEAVLSVEDVDVGAAEPQRRLPDDLE
jgi:hypothetical protein